MTRARGRLSLLMSILAAAGFFAGVAVGLTVAPGGVDLLVPIRCWTADGEAFTAYWRPGVPLRIEVGDSCEPPQFEIQVGPSSRPAQSETAGGARS